MRFDAKFSKMCIKEKLKLLIELVGGEGEEEPPNGKYMSIC